MNWKPVYALLISFSTVITYTAAILIENRPALKKHFLWTSLFINLGILFVFKYFNFINESVFELLQKFHLRWDIPNLDLLLPVGISFYTFQAIGYTIDVYRGELKAERSLTIYALFVSFFPQLVAGPIERAKNLLPQFKKTNAFSYANTVQGLRLMLLGYFMKVVVADRLSIYVDTVYNNAAFHSGSSLLIATLFFSIQIYCDFAGYSGIAIGAAKIMGFDLMTNFNRPYFSYSISEFWHRWHISLSTWFKDYLYIPLGGNRVSKLRNYINLFLTFLISGIWHGANWTFVIWGSIHGFYQIIEKRFKFGKPSINTTKFVKLFRIVLTFILVLFSWIFFRANSVEDAFSIIIKIFSQFGKPFINPVVFAYASVSVAILLLIEVLQELQLSQNYFFKENNRILRLSSYVAMVVFILLFGVFDSSQFIYFQF
jgi:D-alanyl-lipoteichoic acid acyltransferase DltB (MBOAT superfamily)